jgi:arsenate reductase-like glutaredoxin family protein
MEFTDRDFFKNPFTSNEITMLLQGSKPAEMFNFRSPSFKKLDLDRDQLKSEDLIELMLKEPRLIRRPIVKIGRKVYFGASAETLADIIKV